MQDLDDVIEYENESNWLDFKAIQYTKEKHPDLIKDVIALANADYEGDKFIIIGVKLNADGSRDLRGVENVSDDAAYQQLISSNVEPGISLSYQSYHFREKTFGIFRITNCNDKPYLMKKDYQSLKKGDGFIRKGSSQIKLVRKDYDRIYEQKKIEHAFKGKISVVFADNGKENIAYSCLKNIKLPSEVKKEKIKAILDKRGNRPFDQSIYQVPFSAIIPGYSTPYEDISTEELRETLNKLEKNKFDKKDIHALFEKNGTKINFTISNSGNLYLEDATIIVTIPKEEGLLIAQRFFLSSGISGPDPEQILNQYPHVEVKEKHYYIKSNIGNLKHNIPVNIFDQPINVVFRNDMDGTSIPVFIEVHGKNLPQPLKQTLTITVIPPAETEVI